MDNTDDWSSCFEEESKTDSSSFFGGLSCTYLSAVSTESTEPIISSSFLSNASMIDDSGSSFHLVSVVSF